MHGTGPIRPQFEESAAWVEEGAERTRRLIKNLEQVGIVLLPSENANDLNSVVNWAIDDNPFPWIGLRAAWEYANTLAEVGT